MTQLLTFDDFSITDAASQRQLVAHCNFTVDKGQIVALIGESGSGKSITCKAILGLNATHLHSSGSITFAGDNMLKLNHKQLVAYRGKRIAMIMQQGSTAFNPAYTIAHQLVTIIQTHKKLSKDDIVERCSHYFQVCGLTDTERILHAYPHQLSGGMLQRIMIVIAFVLEPQLIIADEPTTALDSVTQYEVLTQFKRLQTMTSCAIIFISHDLAVVNHIADDVVVMRQGRIVEQGNVQQVLTAPQHSYTQYLIHAKAQITQYFNNVMEGSSC